MKHVGQVSSTGRRCIIAFREIYDDQGNVIDPNNCLVIETDSLPDMEHQDMMRIVESEPAQRAAEIYNVLSRERFSNGAPCLQHLSQTGRLRKYPTDKIIVTPDNNTRIPLNDINFMIAKSKDGWTEAQINAAMQNKRDDTDSAGQQAHHVTSESLRESADISANQPTQSAPPVTNSEPGILTDAQIAQNKLSQAAMFDKQAQELRDQAYELDESLKPKAPKARAKPAAKKPAGKSTAPKKTAASKTTSSDA